MAILIDMRLAVSFAVAARLLPRQRPSKGAGPAGATR
jgi:hypothetical protein